MIQFDQLEITNFLSWGDKQVVPLHKQGIVRVEGINKDEPSADSNMAGKSTIVEALLWCLYGRTIRNIRHDSVVNNRSKADCCVSLQFRHGDTNYTVARYRKHHKHRNKLLLFRGSNPISYRHGDDTQAKLESILGCDYEAFSHTTIFGGPRPFALLTDAEQKKVLESFLHFEKFEIALRRTKQLLSEALTKEHELELRTTRWVEVVRSTKEQLQSLSRAEATERQNRSKERKHIKKRLRKLVLPKDVPSEKEVEVAGEVVEALVASLAKAGARRKTIRQRLEALRSMVRNREKLIGKPCPACGQKVAADSVKAFLAHAKKDERVLRGEKKETRRRCKKLERRLSYARKFLNRVQDKYKQDTTTRIKHETLRRELEDKLKTLGVGASSPYVEEIQSLSVRYTKAVSKLLVCEYEKKMLASRIEDLKFWEEGFGNRGVKALIVREALPAMNHKLKEYAQEIFHGTVKIEFSPAKKTKRGKERELFHLRYKSRYGSSSYLGESTGGKKRVDICVLLVFSWLSRTCNILFCDELLDGLDSSGRESILRILASLRGTVLVISHERDVKANQLVKTWTVVKNHGISKLDTA